MVAAAEKGADNGRRTSVLCDERVAEIMVATLHGGEKML